MTLDVPGWLDSLIIIACIGLALLAIVMMFRRTSSPDHPDRQQFVFDPVFLLSAIGVILLALVIAFLL